MRADLREYLEYVLNTGETATVEQFDDDWDPIGPLVRLDLMPTFMIVADGGRLKVTAAGHEALAQKA